MNADALWAPGSKALVPPRLRPGDRVRLVSPASTPTPENVDRGVQLLKSWGLSVEIGEHAFDKLGHYLAGRDEDRVGDLNDALRDRGVRAIFATTGGKGAHRIADSLDFEAARRDPKPLVGFSDITVLHLALWQRCRLVGFYGPLVGSWSDDRYGSHAAEALRCALMTTAPVTLEKDPDEPTGEVEVEGKASGVLLGGNLNLIANAVGWCCPNLDGAILLIESVASDNEVGRVDRGLTQVMNSGCLSGLQAVAVGQFTHYEYGKPEDWSVVDVLRDRLAQLDVPVLGGLPVGHGKSPRTVPLGTRAVLDTEAGSLVVQPGVS